LVSSEGLEPTTFTFYRFWAVRLLGLFGIWKGRIIPSTQSTRIHEDRSPDSNPQRPSGTLRFRKPTLCPVFQQMLKHTKILKLE